MVVTARRGVSGKGTDEMDQQRMVRGLLHAHQGQATAVRNEISGCASQSCYPKRWHLLLKVALCFFKPDNLVKCLHIADLLLQADDIF